MIRKPRSRRLEVERLEDRLAPVVNLRATNALLVNRSNVPLAGLVTGEEVFVRAQYTSTDLTAANQFIVRFTLDGVPLQSNTVTGIPGTASYFWYLGGWFAGPGTHTVTVVVDGNNSVAEADETDNTFSFEFAPNAPTSLPSKFVLPLGGTPHVDWTFVNYADVDPRSAIIADHQGNPIAYDGHDGHDLSHSHFGRMDAGLPVYAAAAGTVVRTDDGHFDRRTVGGSFPANYVEINHGNGWLTRYFHLVTSTVAVQVGDVVTQGQLLGLAGSSGNSSGPHLHFELQHNGLVVEPNYDPDAYWLNPLTYQLLAPVRIMDQGTANYNVQNDLAERPSDIRLIGNTFNGSIYFWHYISNLVPGDVMRTTWLRPNGTQDASFPINVSSYVRAGRYFWFITRNFAPNPGTWQVILTLNGVEMTRETFEITAANLHPEIRVTQNTTYVLDDRTTPFDFGQVALDDTPPTLPFTISNHGYAPLILSDLELPPGFSLVGSLPGTIPAGGSDILTVQLDTARAGVKFGQVRFRTNDPDESVFGFNVSGLVVGADPAGAPFLTLPDPAVAYTFGQPARVLDDSATLSDSDSLHFGGGSLRVEFASGLQAGDRLGIRNQGTGAGQIGVSGNNVTFGGTIIGTFTGGAGSVPLVVSLNANATQAALEALLRNLTYVNDLPTPATAPRYVRFTVIDDTGQESNQPITVVVVAPNPVGVLAFSTAGASVSEDAGLATITVTRSQGSEGTVTVAYAATNGTATSGTDYTAVSGTLTFTNGQSEATFTVPILDDGDFESAETINLTLSNPAQGALLGAPSSAVLTIAANDPVTLQVTSFMPTATGFTVQFSQALETSVLNLYDAAGDNLGPADVMVTHPTRGAVTGSLVLNAAGTRITFLQTGGLLAADALPYTVRLRSAADGFRNSAGALLDGNADGTPGEDYVQTFTVSPAATRVLSVPDVVRGPGQALDVPATGTGLPLRLSDGAGVTRVELTLLFNPALLRVTDAAPGPDTPPGAAVTLDISTDGQAVLVFTSPAELNAGPIDLVLLTASVPDTAPYTAKHALDISGLEINDGLLPALDDDGLHIAAYLGDVTANGRYSSADAMRILRRVVGLDSGFGAYQLADPVIVAGVTGRTFLSSADANRVLQEALGMDRPEIPALPAGAPLIVPGGPDPLLSLPRRLRGRPGRVFTVPVNLDVSSGLESADLALSYDTTRLELVAVERGSLTEDFDLFAANLDTEADTIRIGLGRTAGPIAGRGRGSVAKITFRIRRDAPAGNAIINLRQGLGQTTTQLNEGGLDLNPDPSDEAGDLLDGVVRILARERAARLEAADRVVGIAELLQRRKRRV